LETWVRGKDSKAERWLAKEAGRRVRGPVNSISKWDLIAATEVDEKDWEAANRAEEAYLEARDLPQGMR
jgi:hypothetical protein